MAFLLAAILVLGPFLVLHLVSDRPHRSTATEEAARCEIESLLARRRIAGEIDRDAYRDAMAELAVRDARSRPLRVPGGFAG